MMMSKVILLAVMNVIVMMVYMILLISPPEVELLTENEQLFHSFHGASGVVALLGRRKFKTCISVTGYRILSMNQISHITHAFCLKVNINLHKILYLHNKCICLHIYLLVWYFSIFSSSQD